MKKIISLFCFVILLCTFEAFAAQSLERKLAMERAVTDQLTKELGAVLPNGTFAVFSSAAVRTTMVREVAEGERTVQRSVDDGNAKSAMPAMPGFQDDNLAAPQNARTENERQVYRTAEKEELDKVDVRVLFDSAPPPELVATAQKLMRDRVQSSFGNNSSVSFESADISSAKMKTAAAASPADTTVSAPTTKQQILSYLKRNGAFMIAIFILLAALAFVWNALTRSRRAPFGASSNALQHYHSPYSDNSHSGYSVRESHSPYPQLRPMSAIEDAVALPPTSRVEEQADTLEQLLTEITNDPLLARNFLVSLDPTNKSALYNSFRTSTLKEALRDILQVEEDKDAHVSSFDDAERGMHLRNILRELQQYKRLTSVQLNQKFGFLTLLTPDEAGRLLRPQQNEVVSIVLPYLSREAQKQVVRLLPVDRKTAIFQSLSLSQVPDSETLAMVESELRARVDEFSKQLFMPYSHTDSLLEMMVEESEGQKEVLKKYFAANKTVAEKFKHHTVGFDDLANLQPTELARVIDKVSNEDIAIALLDSNEAQRARMLGALSEFRRRMVNSLLVSNSNARDGDKVDMARRNLVLSYRNIMTQERRV